MLVGNLRKGEISELKKLVRYGFEYRGDQQTCLPNTQGQGKDTARYAVGITERRERGRDREKGLTPPPPTTHGLD